MERRALTTVLYAYPVCISAALLVSHLVLFRSSKAGVVSLPEKSKTAFNVIWFLQAFVSLTLVCKLSYAIKAH